MLVSIGDRLIFSTFSVGHVSSCCDAERSGSCYAGSTGGRVEIKQQKPGDICLETALQRGLSRLLLSLCFVALRACACMCGYVRLASSTLVCIRAWEF